MGGKDNLIGRRLHRLSEWACFRPKFLPEPLSHFVYEKVECLWVQSDFYFGFPLFDDRARYEDQVRTVGNYVGLPNIWVLSCLKN
jgi:hypothetical protein